MRLAVLVVAPLVSLSAQSPDASSLLRQRDEALGTYRSYAYTEVMTVESSAGGVPTTVTEVQAANPGRRRMESKVGTMTSLIIISDGENLWTYIPLLKQYSKSAAGSEEWKALFDKPPAAPNARILRSEVLDVDGQSHDCWVVETREEGKISTSWIDKALGIQLQATTSGKVGAMEVNSKIVKRTLRLNQNFPDTLFVFTPPADAKETPALFAAMLPPKPRGPSQGEPQAFVPNLNPLNRTEPIYPDTAKSKGIHGMVDLLLTLDPQGRVTSVEALSGHEMLRPAAIDAVKQWKFRPVIRNGKPVDAYTDAMVSFIDYDHLSKTVDAMDLDMAGGIAAAARTAELAARFPRSPDQVLADAEQDVNPANRAAAVQALAKTAFDAGALDKARAYAEETLQSATDPKDWNYGNAIYDGNTVLGLVALREGNVDQAKQYLIKAAHTPGSPQLNSFGPDLRLARELAAKGERDAVAEYVSLCRAFWKMGEDKLDALLKTP